MAKRKGDDADQLAKGVAVILGICSLLVYLRTHIGLGWLMVFIAISFFAGKLCGFVWVRTVENGGRSKTASKHMEAKPAAKNLSDVELLLANIDSLSGVDFERLVVLYYKDKGYPVERIGGSGDHGVDIIVRERDGARVAIQCKRQKQDVGNAVVLKLDSGRRAHKCHVGRIITTAYFTRAAEDAAERLRIDLMNRVVTLDKLETWRKKKIAKK